VKVLSPDAAQPSVRLASLCTGSVIEFTLGRIEPLYTVVTLSAQAGAVVLFQLPS